MKTTKYYVDKFKLDQENFQFSREDFLKDLSEDLLELVEKNSKDKLTYPIFKNCVKEMENKFWAISNKKVSSPFSEKLWGAFFALYVVEIRGRKFPEIKRVEPKEEVKEPLKLIKKPRIAEMEC